MSANQFTNYVTTCTCLSKFEYTLHKNLLFIILQAKSWTITLHSPRKSSVEAPRDARTSLQQATKIYRA